MQRGTELATQLEVASVGAPTKVRPDLDPLVNRADLSQQRAELALLSYANAPSGSARRELFDRVTYGEDVDRVISGLRDSRGLNVPGEDRAHLKEYQLKSFITAPRIELKTSVYNQVANPGMDRAAGVYTTPDAAGKALQAQLSHSQLAAVDAYKTRLNTEISQSASALAELEKAPNPGNPEWEKAHQTAMAQHKKLMQAMEPDAAILGMGQARERAHQQLDALNKDPELAARVSPQLKAHYESVARGGGPAAFRPVPASAKPYENVSDIGLKGALAKHEEARAKASGPEAEALAPAIQGLKNEIARRELSSPGTGLPRPTVQGRFAGMERSEDLPLSRERVLQMALVADPHNPNAERMLRELKNPPVTVPGVDNKALLAMYQDRQADLARHRASLRAPLAEVPKPGPTLAERGKGLEASDLAAPPFVGDGPAGLPPAEPPTGGGGKGPGGPNGAGPDVPASGPIPSGVDPVSRFRPAIVSPETHGSQELLKQIQAVEAQAMKRIRQEKIFTAITSAGAILNAAVAIGAEVATAPMNPHADPGKALSHAATAINTVGMGVGQHLRQKVHERTKADSDIKAVIDAYSREQRGHAEEWAEKMSNQMDHLDHLVPPPAELDRLERTVANTLYANHDFKGAYEQTRDQNAYEIHMAAANEMVMSSNPELRETGLRVAQSLRANQDLQAADWKTLQNHVSTLNLEDNNKNGALLVGTYETYLREMEHQGYVAALQEKSRDAIKNALANGELGTLIGDDGRAQALLDSAKSTDPNESRTPAQMLLQSLDQKHHIERSIQASWRDFAARSPIHAERVIHGGMDPATQLAHLYGRRSIEAKTPDRAAVEGLRNYFQTESNHRVGEGNKRERYEMLGIPAGWGDNTVAGSKVGVAPSQNGGSQAMLLGFKPDSNELHQAAVHLFAREGVSTPPISDLEAQGLSRKDIVIFQEERRLDPPPHAKVLIDGDEVRKLPVDKLAAHVAQEYNASVKKAYSDHAELQLDHDAQAYAGMKMIGRPYKVNDAIIDLNAMKAHMEEYKDRNRNAYLTRADTLAAREAIQAGAARTMATQLKESQTMGGFSQVVEANRGHFNYPPHRSALDRDPRNALEGRSGENVGRDLKRLLTQADNSILAVSNEIKLARDKKINVAKDNELLYKLSPKTAQLGALLDTPMRQSQLVGHMTDTDRGSYDAAIRFLDREGYGNPNHPNP